MPRACKVCDHDAKTRIERAYLSSKSIASIARRFDVPRHSVDYHMSRHFAPKMQAYVNNNERWQMGRLLAHFERLRSQGAEILEDAQKARKRSKNGNQHEHAKIALQAIDKIKGVLEMQGKLLGLLQTKGEGSSELNIGSLNVNLFPRVEAVIIQVLEKYPEAMREVRAKLKEIAG